MILRFLTLTLVSLFHLVMQVQQAGAAQPVPEERLAQCYQNHPFFLEALMIISEEDFADQNRSAQRKTVIQKEFDKNASGIRGCLEDVIQYAKDGQDPENLHFVVDRMKEISSIVHGKKSKAKALQAAPGAH